MKTEHHRRTGAAVVLVAAHLYPEAPLGVLVSTAVGWACAGAASPDCDNQDDAQTLDKAVPDEWLGHGGPLKHRGIWHWWGIPAAGWWLWHVQPVITPAWPGWVFRGLWLAWVTHLAMDFGWGKKNPRAGRNGPGIPGLPWWLYLGLGLDPEGIPARVMNWAATLLIVYAAATLYPPLTHYWI